MCNAEPNGSYVELNKSFNYYMGHYKDTVKGIYFLHFLEVKNRGQQKECLI